MRWKDNGEGFTDDGHRVYYSGSPDKHEHGIGFIINSTVLSTVSRDAKQFQVRSSPSV